MAKVLWVAAFGASLCLGVAYWCYVPLPPGSEMSQYALRAFAQFLFIIENLSFDGVPVRVFGRRALPGVTYPAVVHFHGSGWVGGSVDNDHPFLLELWNETNIVFVTVQYRLAPEHLFPAAFDDGRRAVLYLLEHASRFHVDPNKISVAGASSGANVAAAVALWWRDEKITPPLWHQILGCPPLQAVDFDTRSYREFAETRISGMNFHQSICAYWLTDHFLGYWTEQEHKDVLSNKHVDPETWEKYVSYYDSSHKADAGQYMAQFPLHTGRTGRTGRTGSISTFEIIHAYVEIAPKAGEVNKELVERLRNKITDPYAAPLAADNLRDLPRTLLLYGQTDVLRTDAELYAHRLREDGVNVTSISPQNSFHCDYIFGIDDMGPFRYSIAIQNLKEYKDYLKKNVN